MGLVSMILERRESGVSSVDQSLNAHDYPAANGLATKPSSPDAKNLQAAISLRTFAMRIDTAKRRAQKLG